MNEYDWLDWLYDLKAGDYVKLNGEKIVRIHSVAKRRIGVVVIVNGEKVIEPSICLSPLSPLESLAGAAE